MHMCLSVRVQATAVVLYVNLFVCRCNRVTDCVCIYFSGGDNKIGVAVRKPDGSVALPYKWQVS